MIILSTRYINIIDIKQKGKIKISKNVRNVYYNIQNNQTHLQKVYILSYLSVVEHNGFFSVCIYVSVNITSYSSFTKKRVTTFTNIYLIDITL